MPRAVSTLTPDFLEEEVNVRGITYKFRELSIGDYDDVVTKATRKQTNPVTGEETDLVDNALLLKLMVLKSSVHPKLTPEAMAAMPTRVVFKLNQTVNRMHYGDEPDTLKPAEPEAEAEEGKAKGED